MLKYDAVITEHTHEQGDCGRRCFQCGWPMWLGHKYVRIHLDDGDGPYRLYVHEECFDEVRRFDEQKRASTPHYPEDDLSLYSHEYLKEEMNLPASERQVSLRYEVFFQYIEGEETADVRRDK